jgi:hypothetical protein
MQAKEHFFDIFIQRHLIARGKGIYKSTTQTYGEADRSSHQAR